MNPQTIERLWREHNDRALKRLRGALRGMEDAAEDALSDAWMILARQPEGCYLRDEGPQLNAWLVLVGRRQATRRLRENAPDALDHAIGGFEGVEYGTSGNPTAELAERRELVRELLTIVRDDDSDCPRNEMHATLARRRAILARMIGLSYAELGQLTGDSYTKTNRSTSEARELLRRRGLGV